ncbi:MAG: ROK family protein [Oscillospiraceae bacterium]
MSVNIKDENLGEIIKILRQFGPISIKEISRLSRLSVPCVMQYLNHMLEQKLLVETINPATAAGRKPKVYRMNHSCRYVVAVDLGGDCIKAGIADLSGALLVQKSIGLDAFRDETTLVEGVISAVKELLTDSETALSSVDCMIIGNPGAVDPETGKIRMNAASASWHELPIRKLFMEAFGREVLVYNDVNLSAVGERVYGVGKGYDNFIYIRDDVGLKAGIVIHGALFEGEHNAAGEFGLNYFIDGRSSATLKGTERIESRVSMHALVQQVRHAMPEQKEDPLWAYVDGNPALVDLETLVKVLDNPNTFVHGLTEDCARLLAYSVANLVLTLDIGLVVFGGEITRLHNHILKPMRKMLNELLPNPPTILLSELGGESCMYGAISVGLEHAYKNLVSVLDV